MARRRAGVVAWSKFDPEAPPREQPMSDSSRRRVMILKWANWVALAFMLLGFGFLAVELLK